MTFIDTVMGAMKRFSPKKSTLSEVKQSIEPQPKLPSEDVLRSYESRYEAMAPPKTPVDVLREPQIPVQQYNAPSPISSRYPPASQSYAQQTTNPPQKIDLILAEIETVKAQLKVLSEKMDILESHYRR